MNEKVDKPLKWTPDPNVGYSVQRRPDGGMNVMFREVNPATLKHWREFALEHLIDSDRLTRNLYDLRGITAIPDEAINYAVEVNNDPAVRNIRLAVVVSTDDVYHSVQEIQALTTPGGVEMGIFRDMDEAESWLQRPLTFVV